MIFRNSGGLTYHWRARKSRQLWRPFQDQVAKWLKTWDVPRDELILFGPSGGYTLPSDWLKSFNKIYAYDADPFARWFFGRRHGRRNLQFCTEDVFWSQGRLSLRRFREILHQHPRAAILFSNVIGQLLADHRASEEEWNRFLYELITSLHSRRWASYHDLYSIAKLPLSQHPDAFKRFKDSKKLTQGEVTDHLLNQAPWPEGIQKATLGWSLTPKSLHLIEAVHS